LAEGEDTELWDKFYTNYHQFLKVGMIKDTTNRARLAKLCRFNSAQSPEKKIGFEEYVKSMKPSQKGIYFLGGEHKEMLLNSPLLERIVKRGYDVLLFTEPIDEFMAANVQKFETHSLIDVSKEGLNLDDDDKEQAKTYATEFKPLLTYLKDLLSKEVSAVEVSMRLSSSPSALVSPQWGVSVNMERILKAQALGDKSADSRMSSLAKKVLEINPRHPIIKQLLVTIQAEKQNEETANVGMLLYDSASISSGTTFKDPSSVVKRLNRIISQSLGVDPLAVAEEENFDAIPEPAKDVKEEKDDL